jgi:hypothetical protein
MSKHFCTAKLTLFLAILTACASAPKKQPTTPQIQEAQTPECTIKKSQFAAAADEDSLENSPASKWKHIVGRIGENQPFEMEWFHYGNRICGKYRSLSSFDNAWLSLDGQISNDGKVTLLSYEQGNPTGRFEFSIGANKEISGLWTSNDPSKIVPVTVFDTSRTIWKLYKSRSFRVSFIYPERANFMSPKEEGESIVIYRKDFKPTPASCNDERDERASQPECMDDNNPVALEVIVSSQPFEAATAGDIKKADELNKKDQDHWVIPGKAGNVQAHFFTINGKRNVVGSKLFDRHYLAGGYAGLAEVTIGVTEGSERSARFHSRSLGENELEEVMRSFRF